MLFPKFIPMLMMLVTIKRSYSFIAYDCTKSTVNVAKLSAVSTPLCELNKKNITHEKVVIQVNQPKSMENILVKRCYVSHKHVLTRCGVTLDQFQHAGVYTEYTEISREKCLEMHATKKYFTEGYGDVNILNLVMDERNSFSYESIGKIEDGSCSGALDVTLNGVAYKKLIRMTETEVFITEEEARIDLITKKLIMPNGNQFDYYKSKAFSADYGNLYWTIDVSSGQCSNDQSKYTVVFEGIASKVTETDHNGVKTYSYIFNMQEYEVQLYTNNIVTVICGMRSYRTEHPKLLVTEKVDGYDFILRYKQLDALDVNIVTYFNAKIVHVMRHTKDQVDELYTLLAFARCQTENKITHNLLTLSQISSVQFAFDYMQQPGYTAVTLGDVIYVAQCTAVDVMYHHVQGKCFNELPVMVNNTVMFMQPRTKILSNIGTEVTCAPGLQPTFNIMNEWFVPGEHGLTLVHNPEVIHPTSFNFTFKLIKQLGYGGIYTPEALDRMQQLLLTPMRENVIKSSITKALSGGGSLPNGYSIGQAFQPMDYEKIEEKIKGMWSQLFSTITSAGSYVSFFIGCVLIFRCIKFILNTLINSVVLQQEYGFNWRLLFACWENAVHLLLRSKDRETIRRDNTNRDILLRHANNEDVEAQ